MTLDQLLVSRGQSAPENAEVIASVHGDFYEAETTIIEWRDEDGKKHAVICFYD